MSAHARKELVLALVLVGFGLFGLPAAIYVVGVELIGPYEGDSGALGLGFEIVSALLRPSWTAWVLVLSPYLVVQLFRLTVRILRQRPAVTPVTD